MNRAKIELKHVANSKNARDVNKLNSYDFDAQADLELDQTEYAGGSVFGGTAAFDEAHSDDDFEDNERIFYERDIREQHSSIDKTYSRMAILSKNAAKV
jgi:hypothetical protein